ncbi:MAG TPA: polysaccharide lyase family 7 protein, partial [Polyangiaceae bacterium]|nr:polysaccharide lyase family 7 protein [Polyangiaceae bacterium]
GGKTGSGGANATGGTSASGGTSATGGQGGTIATAGTSATGGSAGNTGLGGAPAWAFDYSIWELQLPIGSGSSPTAISPGQVVSFSDAYFYKAADGGQTFMDPATGTTTSGSKHCRTEMRESTSGGKEASWSASGTNTLTVTGKVLSVGGGGNGLVTVGQVFNSTDSIPLCELRYSTAHAGFDLFYEEATGSPSETDLKTPIALNTTQYTFVLSLSNGVLAVTVGGKQVYMHQPSPGTLAKKFYFKFGNYDQNTSAGPTSTTPYTIVEAYGAKVVHK